MTTMQLPAFYKATLEDASMPAVLHDLGETARVPDLGRSKFMIEGFYTPPTAYFGTVTARVVDHAKKTVVITVDRLDLAVGGLDPVALPPKPR